MKDKSSPEFDRLVRWFLAGGGELGLDQESLDQLESLLASDPEARRRFRREANLDMALHEWATIAGSQAAWAMPEADRSGRAAASRLAWRPTAAVLAVGLLVGMLSSTMIFAATLPWRERVRSIRVADLAWRWESPPGQQGIPDTFDTWGGDYSRLVGVDQGVRPPGNGPMLRMLRSDNDRDSGGGISNAGELWRFIDLRPLRQRLGSGPLRLEFAAAFNATPHEGDERYQFAVGMHAFADDAPEGFAALWRRYKQRDESITSVLGRQVADIDLASWQNVSVHMVVPPEATVLLVHTSIGRMPVPPAGSGPVQFPGHYVGDLSLRFVPLEDDPQHRGNR